MSSKKAIEAIERARAIVEARQQNRRQIEGQSGRDAAQKQEMLEARGDRLTLLNGSIESDNRTHESRNDDPFALGSLAHDVNGNVRVDRDGYLDVNGGIRSLNELSIDDSLRQAHSRNMPDPLEDLNLPSSKCGLCNNLEKRNEDDFQLTFDFVPEDLLLSANSGCQFCVMILNVLQSFVADGWSFVNDARRVLVKCLNVRNNVQESLMLEIYFSDDRPRVLTEVFCLDNEDQFCKAVLPRQVVSEHPLSPLALAWVRSHLDLCSNEHASCNITTNRGMLPRRILYLRSGSNDTIQVQLLEDVQRLERYAAVSHCWGKSQNCITTSASLQSHKQQIAWDAIPKTFQDCMTFAIHLNIFYIWIDSLCIIQDSEEDWQIESAKMAGVYQNSFLTLAATGSADDTHGCFFSRPRISHRLVFQSLTPSRVAVRKKVAHWTGLSPDQLREQFPLLTRGWAFQERLLAPRLIHFGKHELVWECRQSSSCECGSLPDRQSISAKYRTFGNTTSFDDDVARFTVSQTLLDKLGPLEEMASSVVMECLKIPLEAAKALLNDSVGSSDKGRTILELVRDRGEAELAKVKRYISVKSVHDACVAADLESEARSRLLNPAVDRIFRDLVEQYSSLQLTRTSDLLPAISGLCERIQSVRADYVAGLWSESLLIDLLWRRVNPSPRACFYDFTFSEVREVRPSWSWMSDEGAVRYWPDIQSPYLDPPKYYGIDKYYGRDESLRIWIATTKHVPIIDHFVYPKGHNHFGSLASAALRIKTKGAQVVLQYSDDKRESCDTKYWIRLADQEFPSYVRPGVFREVWHQLHADYRLESASENWFLANGAKLWAVQIHPLIALVLKRVKPREKEPSSLQLPAHIERPKELWERVGIVRLSAHLQDKFGTDWLEDTVEEEFWIV